MCKSRAADKRENGWMHAVSCELMPTPIDNRQRRAFVIETERDFRSEFSPTETTNHNNNIVDYTLLVGT